MLITNVQALSAYRADHRVWQGIPGIARTKGGKIFVSFYSGGTKETYGNVCLLVKSDDGKNFSEPIAATFKEGGFRCYDPAVWVDPLNRLWFIWNVMPGEEVFAAICDDPDAEVLTWGEEFYIGRGVMLNKPLVLSTGEWLFPIAVWRPALMAEMRKPLLLPNEESAAFVYKTSDMGKSFVRLGGADLPTRWFDEHMLYEKENGMLRMLVRTTNGIGESISYDRGHKWSRGRACVIDGPCSRFFISRLRSGRILLINHYQFQGRNNLCALLSEDDGESFPYSLLLDERDSVAYPDAQEGEDGSLYIVYDRERGGFRHTLADAEKCAREILMARITEEDILRGRLVTAGSYQKRIVSKLGALSPDAHNPFDEPLIEDQIWAERLLFEEGDPILKIMQRYPINCCSLLHFDMRKLDRMIADFQETGEKDLDRLLEIIRFVRKAPKKAVTDSPIISAVKEYVDKHLEYDFTVADIAEHLHVSMYYLSHLFKTVTETTVLEYRNELRLTCAKKRLKDTDESITQIASSLGFCTAAYFSKCFRKSEHLSPSEYRRLHRPSK